MKWPRHLRIDLGMDATVVRPGYERVVRTFRLRQKVAERAVSQAVAAFDDHESNSIAELEQARSLIKDWAAKEATAIKLLEEKSTLLQSSDRPPINVPVAVIEWLYRQGCTNAKATHAALAASDQQQIDVDVLNEILRAADALRNKDLKTAIDWARLNSSRLRRIGSPLEFSLSRAQFIELIRSGNKAAAQQYATDVLRPAALAASGLSDGATSTATATTTTGGNTASSRAGGGGANCMRLVEQCSSLLICPDPFRSGVPELDALFTEGAWRDLTSLFKTDAFQAAGYGSVPVLESILAAGLTALKTPSCKPNKEGVVSSEDVMTSASATSGSSGGGGGADAAAQHPHPTVMLPSQPSVACECPACHPLYFSAPLPHASFCRRSVTRLVDPVTKDDIDENNPAMVLPNGRVFGRATIDMLTSADGLQVICPRTGEIFPRGEVRRAFFV